MKKISLVFVFLMMSAVSFTIAASDYVRGDCNQDGNVSIADVTSLIDYLLSEDASLINLDAADTNKDGNISISDISSLLDYLLAGSWPDEPVTPPEGHTYVDLGLPSGTLWATCNVGASRPEEYGDYFAWGEITPKNEGFYSWSNYKWCEGSYKKLTKYCTNSSYGRFDNKSILEPEDDAAYMNWGPSWRMPTYDQTDELKDWCTWTWTTLNGVNGALATGPNGNTIFLPAGSEWMENYPPSVGGGGVFWTRNLYYPNNPSTAYCGVYTSTFGGHLSFSNSSRERGKNIRPVRAQ